jgi:hypothetical protein
VHVSPATPYLETNAFTETGTTSVENEKGIK